MYVCIYVKKNSQGDFRLMSFTAGCMYVCMYACVYELHSLKAMQHFHLCMYGCM